MLKKSNRLSKRSEFEEVRNGGELRQYPLFGLLMLIKDDEEKRFGFIISRKISKRAVDRNRIKRLIAEGLRKKMSDFKPGVRGIFLVKKSILGVDGVKIEKELEKIK